MYKVNHNYKQTSVAVAKQRLYRLLSSDRMNCSPLLVGQMKVDVFQTISKYMEIKPEDFEMTLTRQEMHIRYTGEE